MLVYTNSWLSSVSTHLREFHNPWLSKYAFVIHVNLYCEICSSVLQPKARCAQCSSAAKDYLQIFPNLTHFNALSTSGINSIHFSWSFLHLSQNSASQNWESQFVSSGSIYIAVSMYTEASRVRDWLEGVVVFGLRAYLIVVVDLMMLRSKPVSLAVKVRFG